jgi:hypothetical protein
MEKAVARMNSIEINSANNTTSDGAEIGGEFPIADLNTNETGVIQIGMDGIGITFGNEKVETS